MAKEDKKKKKRSKALAKKAEQEAEPAKAFASKEAKFGTFPVPRRIVVSPELSQKYACFLLVSKSPSQRTVLEAH